MPLFGKKPFGSSESDGAKTHRVNLIDHMTFEVAPLKSLPNAIGALPPGAEVSVTCSPVKGIEETQRITSDLSERGFRTIPHISARMVRDKAHTAEIAGWLRSEGLTKMFLVGGDSETPGNYFDAASFLRDLLDTDHGLTTIGVAAYPDSHPLISGRRLQSALHEKQMLLDDAGLGSYCSTQMCFDAAMISRWMRQEREQGLTMPIHLGVSGVVDKTKLMTMGVRLGIGQSLRYLKKNRAAVTKMMTTTSFDPNDVLVPLSADNLELGVTGLHVFTFNQVEATNAWRLQNLCEQARARTCCDRFKQAVCLRGLGQRSPRPRGWAVSYRTAAWFGSARR
jgi:methylenetetrahydrofolate reductase (NADPH)